MVSVLVNQNNNKAYVQNNKAIVAPEATKYNCNIDDFLGDTDSNGVLQLPTTRQTSINFTINAKDIVDYGLIYKFYNTNLIQSASFPQLTSLIHSWSCLSTFQGCSSLTSVDLSALTRITGYYVCEYMFYDCSNLSTINLSNLEEISALDGCKYMFALSSASNERGLITSFSFPKLKSLKTSTCLAYCFVQRTALQNLSFPALTSTSFGAQTNQFNNMLQGITGCTVHFPSNLQNVIGSWTDVTAGFGGTNTTILFDLTATE